MKTDILEKTKALNKARIASKEYLVSRNGTKELFKKFGLPVSPNFFSSLVHYGVLVRVSRRYYSWDNNPIHHEKVKLVYIKYHSYQEKYMAKNPVVSKEATIEAAIKLLKNNGYIVYREV